MANGVGGVERPMQRPEEVTLSREEGEALITRLERDALTAADRRVLVKVLTFYFWLLFALREAKLSLKRLKALVFGEKAKKRKPPESGGGVDGSGGQGGSGGVTAEPSVKQGKDERGQSEAGARRSGHGRQSAGGYREAHRIECRHEELAGGESGPAWGRGGVYRIPGSMCPGGGGKEAMWDEPFEV